MVTKAVHDSKSKTYVLSGSKTWITNSPIADVLIGKKNFKKIFVNFPKFPSNFQFGRDARTEKFEASLSIGRKAAKG